jgi:hypothetical protein
MNTAMKTSDITNKIYIYIYIYKLCTKSAKPTKKQEKQGEITFTCEDRTDFNLRFPCQRRFK